jgi:hypothetical protein
VAGVFILLDRIKCNKNGAEDGDQRKTKIKIPLENGALKILLVVAANLRL